MKTFELRDFIVNYVHGLISWVYEVKPLKPSSMIVGASSMAVVANSGGMVLNKYAAIYRQVADELKRILPPGWQTAWAQVEMDEHSGSVACFVASEAAPKPIHVKLSTLVFNMFKQLHATARAAEPDRIWTTGTFILKNDGTFHVDYGYDHAPIEQQYDRRIAWREKYGLA